MIGKVEGVAALDTKEISIDAALVAIVTPDNLQPRVRASYTQRRPASVAAVGARRVDVLHLPRTRLVAIGAGGQSADRADINAHSAFFAFQVIFFIGRNHGHDTAVLYAQCPNVHAFAADPNTAVAQDAARPIEIDNRRPLLLFAVILDIDVPGLSRAIGKSHVLQFA